MTLRIIRDKTTKEMRVMWEAVPEEARIPGTTGGEPTIDCGPNEEFIERKDITHLDALEQARISAGIEEPEMPGKIYIYDDRIEAEPAPPNAQMQAQITQPRLSLAEQIRKDRQGKKVPNNAPVTLEEIETAERTLNGRQPLANLPSQGGPLSNVRGA